MKRGYLAAALAVFVLAGPAWALSDLVVANVRATPNFGGAGTSVQVDVTVFNASDTPARPSINLVLVPSTATPHHEGLVLGDWEATGDLAPASPVGHTFNVTIPAGGPTSTGYICASVDQVNLVRESNENNNRRCTPFDNRPPRPNLVITSITQGAVSGISRRMTIVVRNIGRAPAGEFNIDAFDSPYRRNTLELSPDGPRRAGEPRTASRALYVPSLATGASLTLNAWFTLPGTPASGSRHNIDIMVDGCNRALTPAIPSYCRVEETVEADNARRVVVVAP